MISLDARGARVASTRAGGFCERRSRHCPWTPAWSPAGDPGGTVRWNSVTAGVSARCDGTACRRSARFSRSPRAARQTRPATATGGRAETEGTAIRNRDHGAMRVRPAKTRSDRGMGGAVTGVVSIGRAAPARNGSRTRMRKPVGRGPSPPGRPDPKRHKTGRRGDGAAPVPSRHPASRPESPTCRQAFRRRNIPRPTRPWIPEMPGRQERRLCAESPRPLHRPEECPRACWPR